MKTQFVSQRNLALLLCLFASLAEGSTNTSERITVAQRLWDQALECTGGKPVKSEHYPTEPALQFISAYLFTREQRFAEQAARQLEQARSQEKNGMITAPAGTTRDHQARQIYNFYTAYHVFGDSKYLLWADEGAVAMLKVIPRAAHRSGKNGQTNILFSAGYLDPMKPSAGSLGYNIDANQNAEVALAYSLLYFDPASRFFRDPLCKEIAMEETLASMTLQDMATGAIALTDDRDRLEHWDTLYGGYVGFLWTWMQQLWRDERFEPHLAAAARWLGSKTDLEHGSDRYYPRLSKNGDVSYAEADMRLPLLWHCGVNSQAYITSLFARRVTSLEKPGTENSVCAAPWAWAQYDLMGVPRSYYIDGQMTSRTGRNHAIPR